MVPFCMIMQFSILFMTLHLVRSFQMTSILHLKVGLHRKIVVFQSSLFRCSVSFRCFREGKGVKPNDFCRITCYLSLATNVIRSATRSMDTISVRQGNSWNSHHLDRWLLESSSTQRWYGMKLGHYMAWLILSFVVSLSKVAVAFQMMEN